MGAGCRAAGQLRLSHAMRAVFVAIDERILRNAHLASSLFTARRSARILSAVLAIAFLSVRLSVTRR